MPHSPSHDPADQPAHHHHHHTTTHGRHKRSRTRRPAPRQPQPVPLAVWFVPTHPIDLTGQRQAGPADSWPLPPLLAEKIVNDYANPGSTVLALGGSAATTAAVEHAAARLDCRTPARPRPPGQPATVDLLILTLHHELPPAAARGDADHGDADGADSRQGWPRRAALLSPRGILAVVLPPGRPPQQPAAVVAAAVGVGLAYLQHIPTVLWTPGEDHLTPPTPDLDILTQLWRPGHDAPLADLLPAHADVLLFTAPDPGPDSLPPPRRPLLPDTTDVTAAGHRPDRGAR
jgi:hypothetical protein